MFRVRIIADPFNLADYSEHETAAIVPFLQEQFPVWPETARLYRDAVAIDHDMTPRTEEDVAALSAMSDGLFYVVVYPGDPVTALVTVVATLALTTAVLLFFTPKIPTIGQTAESSNNSLGNRVNKPRPNERVTEIFGQVVAVPELLAVPLTYFENNLEREMAFMCIGRGAYAVDSVKDGDTPLEQIAGAAAKFYGPGTSPNNGDPFLSIGGNIDMPILDVVRLNNVNGQILRAPNVNQASGDKDIRFVYPDTIQRTGSTIDFTNYFSPGDQLVVSGSSFTDDPGLITVSQTSRFTLAGEVEFDAFDPSTVFSSGQYVTIGNAGFAGENDGGGILYVDLSGLYLIVSVSTTKITLAAPDAVNADWNALDGYPSDRTGYRTCTFSVASATAGYNLDGVYSITAVSAGSVVLANPHLVNDAWSNLDNLPGGATDYLSPSLSTSGERWVGPFIVDLATCKEVVCNIVALQGMYRVTKSGKSRPHSVQLEVEVAPVDRHGLATGAAETFVLTVDGDGKDRNPRGETLFASMTFTGRCSVRARRITDLDLTSEDTIVDEIKWRDAFGTAPIIEPHFGDVTTVHSLTLATAGATAVKERKLNCRATRKVLERNADNTFGPALVPSTNAADIICHMSLDPFIGGRSLDELDVPQLYSTIADVQDYFGFTDAGTFSYTFDQDTISAEEMIQAVAQAAFCTAYRQGSVLRLSFERENDAPILLFNHRNKKPGSETRTVTFGNLNDYDGVELDYVSGVDGTKLTIYLPEDQSAVKAKKLEILGVIDRRGDGAHPYLHAARAWNKIRYQREAVEFTSYGEASQLVNGQRIQVADNTRPDIFDGEIVTQNGLILGLSQPFAAEANKSYTIFLQLSGDDSAGPSVERLSCRAWNDNRHVILSRAPSQALVVGNDTWARTTYEITEAVDNGPGSDFILVEKGPYDKRTITVQAINYDPRYYQNDHLFIS